MRATLATSITVAAVGIALLAGPAVAGVPEAPEAPEAAAEKAEATADHALNGGVYDLKGLPLIGAFVALVADDSDEVTAVTVTDTDGRFRVSELPPGPYTLVAQNLGYVSAVVQRVDVPRAHPVSIQLREEPALPALQPDSPLDMGWALRSKVRHVLRQEETPRSPLDDDELAPRSPADTGHGDLAVADGFAGELRVWNFATGSDETAPLGITSLGLSSRAKDGSQSWSMQAHLTGDGGVVARSEMEALLGDDHSLQLGFSYAGSTLRFAHEGQAEGEASWVGSLYAEDTWRAAETMLVSYGVRVEHYNYLDDSKLVSPRVELAFVPVDSMRITTGVSYDATAPGPRSLSFQFDPLATRFVDIIPMGDVEAERTTRYKLGVERTVGQTELQFEARYDRIDHELLGLYMPDDRSNRYLLFNLGEASAKGFDVEMVRNITDRMVGRVSYSFTNRDGVRLPIDTMLQRGMLGGRAVVGSDDSELDITHELQAALKAVLAETDTQLLATYYWKQGVPVLRDGGLEDQYGRLDVGVRQPLPFRALDTEWAAMVQVRNLLGQEYSGVLDLALDDLPNLSRLVAGGLAVTF